jgi:hypothetical protein
VPTGDQQILVTGKATVPASFTVPGNGQIQPKTIFASYDGTGAGGNFLPAIKIISDGGETVGVFPTSTTVVAGASADVTWFPGVEATGTPASTTTPAASALVEQFTPHTFVGTVGTVVPFEFFNTTDKTVFGTNPSGSVTTPPNNTTGDKSLMLLQGGAYVVDASVLFSVAPGAVAMDTATVAMDYNDLGYGTNIEQLATLAGPMGSNLMLQAYHLFMVQSASVPALLSVAVQGATGGNYTVAEMSMVVHWLGGGIGADVSVY